MAIAAANDVSGSKGPVLTPEKQQAMPKRFQKPGPKTTQEVLQKGGKKLDPSNITLRIHDENGNLVMTTTLENFKQHRKEIKQNIKEGKFSGFKQ